MSNYEYLLTKRILLSFSQFLSIFAVILHEVQQCTPNFFHQFDQHPQMLRKNTFFASKWISFFVGIFVDSLLRVKSIFSTHLWMLVKLVEKLRPKRIKIVEMRAKSVSRVKIHRFSINFHYFSSFAQFTLCNCLNCQNQYCSIICIFQNVLASVKFCHLFELREGTLALCN